MHILVHVWGWINVYDFLRYEVLELLDHMVAVYFNFWRTVKVFLTVTALAFDSLTSSPRQFQFLHILLDTCYIPFIIIIANLLRSEKEPYSREYQEKLWILCSQFAFPWWLMIVVFSEIICVSVAFTYTCAHTPILRHFFLTRTQYLWHIFKYFQYYD